MKTICAFILSLMAWVSYAQPKDSYTCYTGGPELKIYSEGAVPDGSAPNRCPNRVKVYGFRKNHVSTFPEINAAPCGTMSSDGCRVSAISTNYYTATSSETIEYVYKVVEAFLAAPETTVGSGQSCRLGVEGAILLSKTITITFVPDIVWKDFPAYLCQNRTVDYDFSSHISNQEGTTYQLDGSTEHIDGTRITGISTLSLGEHMLTAINAYDNGERTATQTFKVYSVPVFTNLPEETGACPGVATTITLSGDSEANKYGTIGYQWQIENENVTDQATFESMTTNSLKIKVPTLYEGLENKSFRVVLTNECTNNTPVYSNATQLKIFKGPNVDMTTPRDMSTCANQKVTFFVTTEFPTFYTTDEQKTLSYRWQIKPAVPANSVFEDIPGAVQSSYEYSVPNTPGGDSGTQFKCIVKDFCVKDDPTPDPKKNPPPNRVESRAALLNVYNSVSVSDEPDNSALCPGSTATFTVNGESHSNTSLQYQWEKAAAGSNEFADLSNETNSTLTLSNVNQNDNRAQFRCKLYDGCGAVNAKYSAVATLRVYQVISVSSLTSNPGNFTACEGLPIEFTISAASDNPANQTLNYKWQWKKDNNPYEDCTAGYEGATSNTLKIPAPTIANRNNVWYQCIISDDCQEGNATQKTSDPEKLVVNPIPASPVVPDVARCGAGALASTANSPGENPAFKWYVNENDLQEVSATPTYTIDNLTANTYYYVSVTVKGCVSAAKTRASFLFWPNQSVNFGGDKVLCSTQPTHDMESDITDDAAKNGEFSWIAGSNSHSGKMFDPKLVTPGDYIIRYVPNTNAKNTPTCYTDTDRKISVVGNGGSNGITFNPTLAPNKTVTFCIGIPPVNLNEYVTPAGGTWDYFNNIKTGLTISGTQSFYTPLSDNHTENIPNKLSYSVNVLGCEVADILTVWVKKNASTPVISGIPDYVCPEADFTLHGEVKGTSDTYSFVFLDPDTNTELSTDNPFTYRIEGDKTIALVSVNQINCRSSQTTGYIKTPFGSGITSDKTVCNAGEAITYTFNGQSNSVFQWDFGDGVTGSIQNPVKYYYKVGDFTTTLKVISSLGCEKSFTLPVRIIGTEPPIITGAEPQSGPGIYPNPVKDILNIAGADGLRNITIYSSTGQKFEFIVTNNRIDISTLASGMYVIKLGEQFFRFIKN